MRWARGVRAGLSGIAALTLLAACEMPVAPPLDDPGQRPPPTVPDRPTPSPESEALRAYFSAVQASQLRQGLLRRDGGGPDTPYTATMLARNFEQIAFFNEVSLPGRGAGSETRLRRWAAPVRLKPVFGRTIPTEQRIQDRRDLRAFASRLGRLTDHPISVGAANPNFYVAFASEDDRAEVLDEISDALGVSLDVLSTLSRDTYCAVVTFGGDNGVAYEAAVALIRAENPALLRLSCIHEEVAQGMGLPNDSPSARPSIFNDDDEFALLTSHDEALLKMLYDDALRPGMRRDEAREIVLQLARQITGEEPAS
ncbi:MAG: DUF2927 domain-containing protein [Pseudomonadota bacterium]